MTRREIELVLYGLNRYGEMSRETQHFENMAYGCVFTNNNYQMMVWCSLSNETWTVNIHVNLLGLTEPLLIAKTLVLRTVDQVEEQLVYLTTQLGIHK